MLHRITGRAGKCGPAAVWDILFADVPFELRAMTLGTYLDERPPGTWAIWASNHYVAWGDGLVADSGAWFDRRPAPWSRATPDHGRVALRRVRIAVRFAPVSGQTHSSREH